MTVSPRFSLSWLTIGIIALALSGVFSVIVAVAWHPSVKEVEIFATLFRRSLIAHVNLSITIWFICVLFMLWSYDTSRSRTLRYFDAYARLLMLASIALMTAATLDSSAIPLLNNYIPTLQHPLFYLSLGCLSVAALVKCVEYGFSVYMCHSEAEPKNLPIRNKNGEILRCAQDDNNTLTTANRSSHLILLIALAAFTASGVALSNTDITGELYYEMLFWGGGHVLQFLWVQVMLVAWVLLLEKLVEGFHAHKGYRLIFWVNLLAVLSTPLPYLLYDVTSGDFRQLFTLLMAWVSGIAPVLFVLLYLWEALRGKHKLLFTYRNPYGMNLWWSLVLFAVGGSFAVLIDGINVKIPAHYHGSLLGITVALMGLTYLMLAEHGYAYITRSKLIFWQAGLLGIGQLMHIGGLFASGGYGVQRKSPDAVGTAMEQADLALRIQSSGGGLAILGGLLFVIICVKAKIKGKQNV